VNAAQCWQSHRGTVEVNTTTFEQRVSAHCSYRLHWPEATIATEASLSVSVAEDAYHVQISVVAAENDDVVYRNHWKESIPRKASRDT